MKDKIFDTVIIGGGPAALTAALYVGRSNLSVLIIEKPDTGALLMAHKIDNYPGIPGSPTGKEVYDLMKEQLKPFDVTYVEGTFTGFDFADEYKIVKTDSGNYKGKTAIIATGWSKGGDSKLPGEKEYLGKGVSYCATCDGAFTRNMSVSLFGRAEEIAEEALFLTKYSKEINMFFTDEEIDSEDETIKTLQENEKVKMFTGATLLEIKGEEYMEEVVVSIGGESKTFKSQFAFLYIGTKSLKEVYGEVATLDSNGYIVTNEQMHTSVEGIFAAGDVRAKAVRQVTTATSDGTIAALEVIKYVLKNKFKKK